MMQRYDAYEVSPVLESDIDGLGGMQCEAYPTLGDAEEAAITAAGEEIETRIIWTVYGHITGQGVEAIQDFETEAQAFEFLFKLSGIIGASGTRCYPLPLTVTVWTCTSDTDYGMETSTHQTEGEAHLEMASRFKREASDEESAEIDALDPDDIAAFVFENCDTFDTYSVEPHTFSLAPAV